MHAHPARTRRWRASVSYVASSLPLPRPHQPVLLEYFHFLFTLPGRSLFYLFCGLLGLSQWPFLCDAAVGAYVILVAIVHLRVGKTVRQKLEALKLRPEAEVRDLFRRFDGDRDEVSLVREVHESLASRSTVRHETCACVRSN